ncbi:rhamnulokinase [Blastopirellula marina]|uniref:Rhamnulokinase n=1 Tax=Blastopirellula marina TaxID=124 RepID=A0A2S8GC53_9BACT|nr:rhamnulokinase family protein [Blastopirellula marina]PQO42038.1 rhamnulokinase [Blastopirellula marina]
MSNRTYLAVDLGASSGRVLGGHFDGSQLQLEEVHRFENGPIALAGHLHWDLLQLWQNIKDGLSASGSKFGKEIRSIGVDTWGVDFALLGRNDELLGNPYHYRDPRTSGMFQKAFELVPREEIFAETGLQFMEINTLYQLLAMKLADSSILESAEHFLMMPDLFHWLLTGEKGNELTNATTTQLFNPVTKSWSKKLIDRFGLPEKIFGEIVDPGTTVGPLRETVLEQIGLSGTKVVRPGTHDTASAVVAVPAQSTAGEMPNWCYISSGTWSLMGVETPRPIINDQCAEFNYTNEGGVYGTTRLLKNIAGLWLVQECRRIWKQRGHEYGYSDLVRMSQEATPLASFVNPDHPDFVAPQDMPAEIRDFCQRTGQTVPQNDGAVVRCVLESLAMRYRVVHRKLQDLTGTKIDTIHIVGGGTQNQLLCQMAADACNCQVIAGPVEATAIGNLMLQAVASGDIGSLAEGREVIRNSFPVVTYTPKTPTMWDDAFPRFEKTCV